MDDHSSVRSADVVDFAAFRARRRAEQPTLFDEPVEPREAWPAPSRPPGHAMTQRAFEHRERMLRHLADLKLGGVKS